MNMCEISQDALEAFLGGSIIDDLLEIVGHSNERKVRWFVPSDVDFDDAYPEIIVEAQFGNRAFTVDTKGMFDSETQHLVQWEEK